ncbi:MAG: hypothetical protein J0M12_02420 [Deltaproteobacteria bacterium]|nr:hypothetical protein [Deltaproteobacteria bacterium]
MSLERLDISRLSPEGEVTRKITCLAGRVTVFRANSEPEFDLYRSALAGWKTAERVSVLLDGQAFSPAKHFFIGFGEAYATERGNDTLKKVLLESGIEAHNIEASLLSFGLGGLADAACKALSPAQERLLRILAATADPNHVCVLYEPFEILPEAWREKAADTLARFAWERKAIVVVVKITSRPECWIENEHISRVQLERPRKRTIGFGADSAENLDFVARVRRESAAFDLKALKQEPVKHITATLYQKFMDSRLFGYSVVILTSVGLSALYFSQTQSFQVASPTAPISISSGVTSNTDGSPSVSSSAGQTLNLTQSNPPAERAASAKKLLVLDGYDADLKDAIVLSFTTPDEVLQRQRAAVHFQPPAEPLRTVHFEHFDAPTDFQQSVDTTMDMPMDEMSLEARREEIRQRFLAAIQANQ